MPNPSSLKSQRILKRINAKVRFLECAHRILGVKQYV